MTPHQHRMHYEAPRHCVTRLPRTLKQTLQATSRLHRRGAHHWARMAQAFGPRLRDRADFARTTRYILRDRIY